MRERVLPTCGWSTRLAQTLEVYRLEEDHWILLVTDADDDVVRAEPFAAIEVGLTRWWLPTAP
jgi:hypothetical protein